MAKTWQIVLLVLIAAVSAMAQNPARGVSVTGVILDPSGASTPDATVTLKQGSNKVLLQSKTDTAGRFRLDGVQPGTYSIEVEHEGFKISVTPLKIFAQAPAPLTITLALAGISSEIAVAGADTVQVSTEAADNRDAASADQNLLEQVPIFDQDYVATMSAFLDPAALGTGGPQLMVNGIEVSSVIAPPSTIQEIRINQNPYAAEIARPGRGTLEIITKDAASSYHATFNFTFRDAVMNARDAFALTRPPEQRRIFEGAFSGPLGHSKTWSFLLSGHRQEEDLQSIVFAEDLNGPIQENVASPKRDTQVSFRVGHQFNTNHSVYWQYNEWDYPSYNQGLGNGKFTLPEAATNSYQWERELIFNDRYVLSSKWLLQFQILLGRERHQTVSVNSAPQIVVRDSFTSGGAQIDSLEIENHVQLNEIVSWSSKKHFLKFGLNVPDWSQRNVDNHNNFGGTYIFASLQDYAAGRPQTFKEQQGPGHAVYWQKEWGAFVQDDYKVRPNLSLSLGLRYNWQNLLHDNTQFAPRLAFAYSPDKARKIVIRGGAGIFYDRTGAGPIGDLRFYNGQVLRSYTIINPTYPIPNVAGQPTDVVRLDPTVREPYSIQYSLGVERQLSKKATIAVTYSGSRGIGLFRSRDINAPLPPSYTVIPDTSLGVIRQIESSGRQAGDSMDVTFRGEITHRLGGLIQYTLSRTYNNTSGINSYPANQYDLSGEWGRADFDQRHRLNLLESFAAGKGFTIGVGLAVASGKPYTLTTGLDSFNTGLSNARPAGVPRNSLEGSGLANLDLRVSRDFNWSKVKKEKGVVTTIAVDAFNALNHVNYVSFVGNESSQFFGQPVSAMPARRLQLTLRSKF